MFLLSSIISVQEANDSAERNGQKLYVPVERPTTPTNSTFKATTPSLDEDVMHLDDTKHKVYIYDLDAELSDSESSSDEGKLIFLPDIQKHLRESRIPASVLANEEGELAGYNKQLVLYHVPTSLSVPEDKDTVRKAIIETRARAREKAMAEKEQKRTAPILSIQPNRALNGNINGGFDARKWMANGTNNGIANGFSPPPAQDFSMDDPDAMDLG